MRPALVSAPTTDPWRLEIVVVRNRSHTSGERQAIRRDVERGVLLDLRRCASVDRSAFESLSPEHQHLVRMRALAAVTDGPVVFCHFSAAVAHHLPVLRSRLARVHVIQQRATGAGAGIAPHRFPLIGAEVMEVHGLLITTPSRTIVDLAGAAAFEEGVMAADAALRAGIPRGLLELAVDLTGQRQASSRTDDVITFASPAAESAAESRGRVTMFRIGVEPPQLQHRFVLPSGRHAHPDFLFPVRNAAAEADGDVKYLDPEMAPDGIGAALLAEKQREDELRSLLAGLVRFGWRQSGSTSLLRPLLARAGVLALSPRPSLTAYAEAARDASQRFIPSSLRSQNAL